MGALGLSGAFKSLLFGDGNYMECSTKTETVCSVLPSVSVLAPPNTQYDTGHQGDNISYNVFCTSVHFYYFRLTMVELMLFK